MMSNIQDKPSVSGTKMKWYIAVAANCSRDRSTTVGSIMAVLPVDRTGRSDDARTHHIVIDGDAIRFDERIPEGGEQNHLQHQHENQVPPESRAQPTDDAACMIALLHGVPQGQSAE